jgi:Tfp pilus assembly protein PilN
VKAVNLIPADARRAGVKRSGSFGPGALLLVGLVVVLGFVTVLVLTDNTISSREARLQTLRAELSSQEQVASRLGSYERFSSLAQARAATVRSIAGTRFDWHAALSDLARVVPKTTTLQSLTATVSPSASTGAASAGGSGLRSIIAGPAFEMTGCSATQDDVAQLMSSLRTMDGVQRVTLSSSTKSPSTGGSSSGSSSSTASGCANGPSFHLIVFFTPLPTTAPAANGSVTPQQVSSTATSGSAG